MIVRDRNLVYRCIHLSTVISLHFILQVISLFQCLISVVDGFACDIARNLFTVAAGKASHLMSVCDKTHVGNSI